MSILEAYEPGGEPIITPDKFYDKRPKLTDVAVVCFSFNAKNYVLSHYQHELYLSFRATSNGRFDVYYLPELKVLFFLSFIGASSAGGLLHEIAYMASITKFVYFGSCGVLDDSLQGKYIAPTECYREEGFSYHFAAPSDYMPIKNASQVYSSLKEQVADVVMGKGWTTDAIYNETKKKFAQRRKEGVLCVDMEASGLQAIANHIGVEVYIFFFAGDILGESWTSGDLGGEREIIRQTSAVELALRLGQSLL